PDDLVEVRRIPSKRSTWCRASELPGKSGALEADNAAGQNIYVGANPRCASGNGCSAEKCADKGPCGKCFRCVTLARCLFVDFDGITVEDARERIRAAGLPPPTLLTQVTEQRPFSENLWAEICDWSLASGVARRSGRCSGNLPS
ncbi:MAG TPA: hypothetical protein VMS96_05130, partial [Terriglobales bacterium]|nr:hypothetical protein [Terriglobales bacterium]